MKTTFKCIACGIEKSTDLFSKSKGTQRGHIARCKKCREIYRNGGNLSVDNRAVLVCKLCGIEKLVEFFPKVNCNRHRYSPVCLSCQAQKYNTRRQERRRLERLANPKPPKQTKEELAAKRHLYHLQNRENRCAYARARHHANKDQINAQRREFRRKHKEHVAALNKKYFVKNTQWRKEWYAANREKILRQNKEYRKRNKTRYLELSQRRRCRVNGTADGTALKAFETIRTKDRVRCYYCGKVIPGKLAHMDHVVPVSKGGQHSERNLAPACPKCNLSKCAKLPSEFAPSGQPLLNF